MPDLGERRTAGDLLVRLLRHAGVEAAFGLVSVHNLPLIDAVARDLRFVPVRHEAAAVNAADAYGRARGQFGVAITSTGTGAGNAAGSLVEALTAGSAVLHLTGQIDSPYLGAGRGFIHETRDQLTMLRAVSKHAETVRDPSLSGKVLVDAVRRALTAPRGPVSIEWPADLQYEDASVELGDLSGDAAPPADDLERALDLIRRARRPLVWAGGGAVRARDEVLALLDRLGAGLLTSNAGRGTVREDDRRVIGNFASSPGCEDLLAEADLLLSIGTHFRSNETRTYRLALPTPHVQIDVDSAAIGRVYPVDAGIVGDAATTLRALLAALPEQSKWDQDWIERVAATRRRVRDDLRAAAGVQADLCDVIRNDLPDSAVIARDVTIPSSMWGNRLLEIYDPRTNIFARGGGIGQGLAMGIGAAIARPDAPGLVILGDGGAAVHLGEFATLAQEQPDLVVLIFNDRGYGVLRNMQDHHLGRRSGVDLVTPDFSLFASSMDLPYSRASDVDSFSSALASALDRGGPSLIEIDVVAMGPMPRPFVPPVDVPEQKEGPE